MRPVALRDKQGSKVGNVPANCSRPPPKHVNAEFARLCWGHSGERLSRLFGYMMDTVDVRGVEFAEERGHTFTELNGNDLEALRSISDTLVEEWAASVADSRGVDGMEAMRYFHEQLAAAAEEESVASLVPQEFL